MSKTIVIIGGGFCGTLAAVHLLRRGIPGGGRVVLVNRSGWLARGVAYGTRAESHVLNVPAARMSPFPDDEDAFLRFVQAREPGVTPGSFVPRKWYGDFLEWLLWDAQARAASDVVFSHRIDHACAVRTDALQRRAEVVLASGETLRADRVVLAIGNFPPADPGIPDAAFFAAGRRYVRDPWAPGSLEGIDPERPVLLIGTGLTMIDVALSLRAQGLRAPIHAVSRRGLLPQPHRSPAAPPRGTMLPGRLFDGPPTVRHFLRTVRAHVRTLAPLGVDWRDVVTSLRPITARMWESLDERERARFLRHLQPYWDVHRHRAAPELGARVREMIASGVLLPRAARLLRCEEGADGVRVTLRPRGARETERVEVGAVINCTGPAARLAGLREPLLQSLADAGDILPDPLGLGLAATDDYALLDVDGRPSPVLFYVGPFLKARFWEATAVPELRLHAARLVDSVLASLTESADEAAPLPA